MLRPSKTYTNLHAMVDSYKKTNYPILTHITSPVLTHIPTPIPVFNNHNKKVYRSETRLIKTVFIYSMRKKVRSEIIKRTDEAYLRNMFLLVINKYKNSPNIIDIDKYLVNDNLYQSFICITQEPIKTYMFCRTTIEDVLMKFIVSKINNQINYEYLDLLISLPNK